MHSVEATETVTQEYYDVVVRRDLAADADYAAERLVRKLGKLRTPREGDAILDVGCSIGVITAALNRRGFVATGVDVVPEFVREARERFTSARFVVGRAESLPFADSSFDFVTLSSLIEHVDDWRAALREAARVLADGGVLYVSTSNRLWPMQSEIRYLHGFGYLPAALQRRIYTWVMAHRPELVEYTHLPAYHWLTYWQLAGELRRQGLEPHSWMLLADEDDVPARYRRFVPLLRAIQRSRVPIFALAPFANLIVAAKPASG